MKNTYIPVYPKIYTDAEYTIDPSAELYCVFGEPYFFSADFKLSEVIIRYVLSKYSAKSKKSLNDLGIKKPLFRKILHLIQSNHETLLINKDMEADHAHHLAYYKNPDNDQFYLTLTDLHIENESYPLTAITSNRQKIMMNGEIIFEGKLNHAFVALLNELIRLHSDVRLKNMCHPLQNEAFETKYGYIKLLAYTAFSEGWLSAGGVITLEMIARNMNISSRYVLEVLQDAAESYEKSKRIYRSAFIALIHTIPEHYHGATVHDAVLIDVAKQSCECGRGSACLANGKMKPNRLLWILTKKLHIKKSVMMTLFGSIRCFMYSANDFNNVLPLH